MASPYEKLLADLVRADVRFITVGGLAVALNGFVRTTDDVDILVQLNPPNIERLLMVLGDVGQGFARELSPADFPDEEGAVRVIEDFPIDIFVRMAGRRYEDLLPNLRFYQLDEVAIPYLDAHGLIALKEGSLRDRDQYDVIVLKKHLRDEPD